MLFSSLPLYLLAGLLQIQQDFSFGTSSVRVALSDLLLPFFLAYAIFYIYQQKDFRLSWQIPKIKIWFLSFSFILILSLGMAYFYEGHVNSWAVKRLLGWPLLIGYFFLGSLIGSYSTLQREKFIKAFIIVYVSIAILLISLPIIDLITPIDFTLGVYGDFRLRGFVENPNGYGLLGVCVLALLVPYLTKFYQQSFLLSRLGNFFIPLSIGLTASRGAILSCLGIFLPLYRNKLIERKKFVYFSGCFLATFAFVFSLQYLDMPFLQKNLKETNNGNAVSQTFFKGFHMYIAHYKHLGKEDLGVVERLDILKQSLSYWSDKPLLGVGLGNSLEIQKHNGIENPIVPHNTAVWILSEMGIIGFALVFFLIIKVWCLALKRIRRDQDPFALGFFALMISMGIGSMATDISYHRHLWVFLGLFLVTQNYPLKDAYKKTS